jgi:hypothetical protein
MEAARAAWAEGKRDGLAALRVAVANTASLDAKLDTALPYLDPNLPNPDSLSGADALPWDRAFHPDGGGLPPAQKTSPAPPNADFSNYPVFLLEKAMETLRNAVDAIRETAEEAETADFSRENGVAASGMRETSATERAELCSTELSAYLSELMAKEEIAVAVTDYLNSLDALENAVAPVDVAGLAVVWSLEPFLVLYKERQQE